MPHFHEIRQTVVDEPLCHFSDSSCTVNWGWLVMEVCRNHNHVDIRRRSSVYHIINSQLRDPKFTSCFWTVGGSWRTCTGPTERACKLHTVRSALALSINERAKLQPKASQSTLNNQRENKGSCQSSIKPLCLGRVPQWEETLRNPTLVANNHLLWPLGTNSKMEKKIKR